MWDNYPDTLKPSDIQKIMGKGRRQTYEWLNDELKSKTPKFRIIRDGRLMKIPKESFKKWYLGT